jgi:hypothetical protein
LTGMLALAVVSALFGGVVVALASLVMDRREWSARSATYVEHALRNYPVGRCHCPTCALFRAENGWPP